MKEAEALICTFGQTPFNNASYFTVPAALTTVRSDHPDTHLRTHTHKPHTPGPHTKGNCNHTNGKDVEHPPDGGGP
jgi:hypothetical protein